jgi:signal transducing adaptor molecule
MSWFRTRNQFDDDIEKATNEKNVKADWSKILEFCERVKESSPISYKDCLKSIIRRMNHQNPRIALQAIMLLDAVVNNCGKPFRLEIASSAFESDYRKLLGNRSHQQ